MRVRFLGRTSGWPGSKQNGPDRRRQHLRTAGYDAGGLRGHKADMRKTIDYPTLDGTISKSKEQS